MNKIYAFLLVVCMLLSGCGQKRSDSKETVGQPTEQVVEIETERETETEIKEAGEETEIAQEETETKQVPESEDNINAQAPLDLTGEDPTAYDLSWEELKSLRKEREVRKASQETDLPRELAELLQDILIRQLSERSFTEDFSVDDCFEPYKAKNYEVDQAGVTQFLGDSIPYDSYTERMREAYIVDLDGDGKEELIILTRTSGTIGYSFFDIWRQKEDDPNIFWEESYTYWYSYTGLLFIGGHYYYVAELIDYSTGEYEGFLVFSFPGDGTVKLDKVTIESQENGKV